MTRENITFGGDITFSHENTIFISWDHGTYISTGMY